MSKKANQNFDAAKIGMQLIRHCEDKYPPVTGAKALLFAAVSMAKAIGVSRKVFLDTAKSAFDTLGE